LQDTLNLLIVDDSSSVRRLIRSIVGQLADEIVDCEDGAQAMSAYMQHRPDFVLMDIEMKHVDGLTATREIKAADPQAMVFIVTNYDAADLREAAQQAGACGYVLKENLLELVGILQQASRSSSASRARAPQDH
jgi:CheY-like chemotaxis protein